MSTRAIGGIHTVRALLEHNPQRVTRLHLAADRDDQRLAALLLLAEKHAIPVVRSARRELEKRNPELVQQGVIAECLPAEPLSEPALLQRVAGAEKPVLILILDGVTDPHNLGAILRTADATGVDVVVTPKAASVGITPVVSKVASGAAETVALCRVANLARTLGELKQLGVWLYGTGDAHDTRYTGVDYRGPVALLLGAEGRGLRRRTREACDGLVSIPMLGAVESLNVSVAAGICLYEVVRQRSDQQE